LPLKPGEKLHEPLAELAWTPPGGRMTVTLVDVDGKTPTSRLVVWGDGKRHDIVSTRGNCLVTEHGVELATAAKNTVLFRCETYGKVDTMADEWLLRWTDAKDFPTIYRHWRGPRFHREPKWAGGKQWYPEQEVDDNDMRECCCQWEDEGEESLERTSMRYCKGSTDHHGVCVADSKCKKTDD
jgi:hypothetical protein